MATNDQAAIAAGATSQDIALIRALKTKAAEFERHRLDIQSLAAAAFRANDYDLSVELGRALESADSLKGKIQWTVSAVDSAVAKWRELTGGPALAALPALLLPVGIAALIGAMSYWIADAVKLKARATARLRLQREFEQAGDPPDVAASKAAAIVKAQEPAAIPAWVMLGGLALLAWQVLRG